MSADKSSIEQSTGLKAVLDKALESYDKLPMLEIVFERLVRLLTTALRNLTSETVDITIKNFSSLRFASYYNTIKPPCSIIVFKVIEWENLGLVVIDSTLVYTLVDLLFGGKKNESASRVEGRGHTYIEQALIKQISEVMLSELSSAFDAISPATCVFERLESNPNFAAITRSGDAVILLKLNVDLDGRGGVVDIVIPYSTIEPIKPLLQQVFIGEKFGSDAAWEENMLERVYSVDLPLEAVIIDRPTKLSEVANLKVGDTIVTSYKKDEDVYVRCAGVNLFKGQVGKLEEKVAINITMTTNGEEQ
jgi:flagellar motor switch protein FliM